MRKIKNPTEKALFFSGIILYIIVMRLLNATCIFKSVFKIPCFGCGMTRACLSLINFDFHSASVYHPLWFLTPLIILYILFDGRLFGKSADRIIITVMIAAFMGVWVLRIMGKLPVL